jgi:hypothetical protein
MGFKIVNSITLCHTPKGGDTHMVERNAEIALLRYVLWLMYPEMTWEQTVASAVRLVFYDKFGKYSVEELVG